MEKFELHILGCGSALPTTRHLSSIQVINLREKLFMIDCGEGAQLQLRRSKLKFSRLNHIFISHLHGDHCFGLMGLVSTFGMLGRTADLHIYSPEGLEGLLAPLLQFFCQNIHYQIVFHTFSTKQTSCIYEDRSVAVHTIPLKHRVPCCGFLFQEKPTRNQTQPPRRYAYCSDTIYNPSIVPQIAGVNLLYHEATFIESALPRAKETHHTTAKQAGMIAQAAGVQQLIIGHFSARYTDEQVLLDEATAQFPATILAQEGLTVEVKSRSTWV